ncbi:Hypothetical protein I595_1033 [Croceitalea dokdonensis DOKDO 023]|uniref:Uncharacterized protein n=1 Tax=Croceitalea dokdonensis DOKDO 023 TaxID=1300341 RepID=A0A0P7B2S0_9FLAO|nr:Hypothetical protein I595_1033 [Croceitalea dokdonensis DOKDO 023]
MNILHKIIKQRFLPYKSQYFNNYKTCFTQKNLLTFLKI